MRDSKARFSDRVDSYSRFRPSYPRQVVELLSSRLGLEPPAPIADVGAGTGILTGLLLEAGYEVFAVEPNAAMRGAADAALSRHPRFHSVDGAAEATGLPGASVAAVTAAQAFHWFEVSATRNEFMRILRPGGVAMLIWNQRRADATPFLREYEAILRRHSPDYVNVSHKYQDAAALAAFFAPHEPRYERFEYVQAFDWDGLCGRVLSSSYVPTSGAEHDAIFADLRVAFDRGERDGIVRFEYDTDVYFGPVGEPPMGE